MTLQLIVYVVLLQQMHTFQIFWFSVKIKDVLCLPSFEHIFETLAGKKIIKISLKVLCTCYKEWKKIFFLCQFGNRKTKLQKVSFLCLIKYTLILKLNYLTSIWKQKNTKFPFKYIKKLAFYAWVGNNWVHYNTH